jgi:hypothetical protein
MVHLLFRVFRASFRVIRVISAHPFRQLEILDSAASWIAANYE